MKATAHVAASVMLPPPISFSLLLVEMARFIYEIGLFVRTAIFHAAAIVSSSLLVGAG